MKLGLVLPYEGSFSLAESIELTRTAEGLGYDSVWVPEAWGIDAVSVLGALAVKTERIRLGTGILNVFSRTPALLGQTAATLDAISGGRFILGLGTSGPQVVAGWHGLPFDRPLQRMRETVEIVRQVVRRQPLRFEGEIFRLSQGLKLLSHPLRDRIPIYLATLTPAGLRLTGELADGWMRWRSRQPFPWSWMTTLHGHAMRFVHGWPSMSAGWDPAPRTFTTRP